MDHVNRTGQLRPDRRDDQRTDDYDRAVRFTLLPYGTLRYHGAPAENLKVTNFTFDHLAQGIDDVSVMS